MGHTTTSMPARVTAASTLLGALKRALDTSVALTPFLASALWFTIRDVYYFTANSFLPSRQLEQVVAKGQPGHGGQWPKHAAPIRGEDSRSPCPALNTLANHNILPRNGKHLTYKQLSKAIQLTYHLTPSLADQLTSSAMALDQGRGWIDLHDLNALNVVQHDASFTRPDIAFCPDQSFPHKDLVEQFLANASDDVQLTLADMSYYSGLRRAECRRTNGQYSLKWSFLHKFFGSGNAALMYAIFGGKVDDLRSFLADEKLPDGWQPANQEFYGHTILQAQINSLAIEFNINEQQKLRPADALFVEPNGI